MNLIPNTEWLSSANLGLKSYPVAPDYWGRLHSMEIALRPIRMGTFYAHAELRGPESGETGEKTQPRFASALWLEDPCGR